MSDNLFLMVYDLVGKEHKVWFKEQVQEFHLDPEMHELCYTDTNGNPHILCELTGAVGFQVIRSGGDDDVMVIPERVEQGNPQMVVTATRKGDNYAKDLYQGTHEECQKYIIDHLHFRDFHDIHICEMDGKIKERVI